MDYSMPNYIPNLLKRIEYKHKSKPQHAPFPCLRITHGQKTQLAITDKTAILNLTEKRAIQPINGSLLYFGRMIEEIILVGTNDIATEQAQATEQTKAKL